MPFFPKLCVIRKKISSEYCHIPAVIFFASLDFGKNCYSQTASKSIQRLFFSFRGCPDLAKIAQLKYRALSQFGQMVYNLIIGPCEN